MADAANVATGAVTGATTGASAGPWGAFVGALVGAGTSIYASNQAGKAGDAMANANAQGLAATTKATGQAQQWLKPYRESGAEGLSQYNYLMGLGDPTELAETEANFDEAGYRKFLIERAGLNLAQLFDKDPEKAKQKLAKQVNAIDTRLEKRGAWRDYQMRKGSGATVNGDIWKEREVYEGGAGQPERGFLMQRFGAEQFEKEPGYQFRMDEGAKQVEGSAAARGGLLSGAALKAMQRYGQDFASNEYGNAYNRFTADQSNIYGRLTGSTDMGMRAAGAMGSNAIYQGQQVANSMADLGNIRAGTMMAQADARKSGYESVANNALDYWAMTRK
jgi:hypothetical protein